MNLLKSNYDFKILKFILRKFKILYILRRIIRPQVVEFACQNDVGDCVDKSKNYFEQWTETENFNKYF